MTQLRPAITIFLFLLLVSGAGYPLVTTLAGQWLFPFQANGSLIRINGEVRGSLLLGQTFTDAGYFHTRPSATSDTPYNPMASGGSNLATSNPALIARITADAAALRQSNPEADGKIPVDLLTASGSGLDNGISEAAAQWQLPRVAAARGMTPQQLQLMIEENTVRPWPSFTGATYVNVTRLNAGLDRLQPR